MKKLFLFFLVMISTLCGCTVNKKSLVDDLYSKPIDENIDPIEVYDALYDNEISIHDIPMNEYGFEELNVFFSAMKADEVYLNISNSETWTMHDVNDKFPIRILRKMHNNMFHKFYTVYQVSEGGCYYVFFSLMNNENMNDTSLKLMNDYAYVSFVYYFDGTYADQKMTEKLEVYKHTWQDVYEIDNFMQTWHSGQSTINTEIIIADEETKELKSILIGYERYSDSLKYDEEGRRIAERSDYYIEHIRSEEALDPDDTYCLPLLIYDFDLPEGTPEWAKKYYLHLEE